MVATIESIVIKGITIKKGTSVEIDIWQDGHTMEVTVIHISLQNNTVCIDCVTNYGSPICHTAEQWEEMLVRKI